MDFPREKIPLAPCPRQASRPRSSDATVGVRARSARETNFLTERIFYLFHRFYPHLFLLDRGKKGVGFTISPYKRFLFFTDLFTYPVSLTPLLINGVK